MVQHGLTKFHAFYYHKLDLSFHIIVRALTLNYENPILSNMHEVVESISIQPMILI